MQFEDIHSDAQAVIHTATFFDELKVSASRLLNDRVASERGYFIPSEDEEVRHLLVSYWQSRKALMELIQQIRDEQRSPEEAQPSTFLIAYAAAVLLVDAARFLRATFHDRPVVVEKLNEPEPTFEIPAAAYDAVQRSLTDPIHVWHLYHATEFFDDHHDDLRRVVAQDARLGPVWRVIVQNIRAVRVSPSEYAKARLAVRSHQIAENLGRTPMAAASVGEARPA